LALLGSLGSALTFDQVRIAVQRYLEDAARRKLPMTNSAVELRSDEGVRAALHAVVDEGVVARFDDGPDTVYVIGPDQHLAAAFYRNSIIHHFLNGSITQLALVRAAETGVDDPLDEFWNAAMRLRDVFKFEFFFQEKGEFRDAIASELALIDPNWEEQIAKGPDGIAGLLRGFDPLSAHSMLRSFVEAYSIVAVALERLGSEPVPKEDVFLTACDGLGRQRLRQRLIQSPESVSKHLFQTGLQLVSNLGLTETGADVAPRRTAFAQETRHLLRQLDAVQDIAAADFARMLSAQGE
jgi:glycerol-3-phosphate O-acyltransferase